MTHINRISPDALALGFSMIPREKDDNGKTLACLMRVCKTWRNTILAERHDELLFQPIAKQLALPFLQDQPDINNCKLWRSLCQYGGAYRVIEFTPDEKLSQNDKSRDTNYHILDSFMKEWQLPVCLNKTNGDSKTVLFVHALNREVVTLTQSKSSALLANSKYLIVSNATEKVVHFYEKGQLKITRQFHFYKNDTLYCNDTEFAFFNEKTNQIEIRNIESWEIRCAINFKKEEFMKRNSYHIPNLLTNRFFIRTEWSFFEKNRFIIYDLEKNSEKLPIPVSHEGFYRVICENHKLVAFTWKSLEEKELCLTVWDLEKQGFPQIFEKDIFPRSISQSLHDGYLILEYVKIEQDCLFALITNFSSSHYYLICNLKTGNCHYLHLSEKIVHIRPELPNIFIRYWGSNGELRERVISFPSKEIETPIVKEEKPGVPTSRVGVITKLFTHAIQTIRLGAQRIGSFAWTYRRLLILTALVVGGLAAGNHFAKLKRT